MASLGKSVSGKGPLGEAPGLRKQQKTVENWARVQAHSSVDHGGGGVLLGGTRSHGCLQRIQFGFKESLFVTEAENCDIKARYKKEFLLTYHSCLPLDVAPDSLSVE